MENIVHITSIFINNYRVFKNDQNFELRDFQFLIGPNNVGKSTLQHFLNLMKECTSKSDLFEIDLIKSQSVSKFCFGEIVNHGENSFSFGVEYKTGEGLEKITYCYEVENDTLARICNVIHIDSNNFSTQLNCLAPHSFEIINWGALIEYHFERMIENIQKDKIIQKCLVQQQNLQNVFWRMKAKRKDIEIKPSKELLEEAESIGIFFANSEQLDNIEAIESEFGVQMSYFFDQDGCSLDLKNRLSGTNELVKEYEGNLFKTPILIDAYNYFTLGKEEFNFFVANGIYSFDEFIAKYYYTVRIVIQNSIILKDPMDSIGEGGLNSSTFGDFLSGNLTYYENINLWERMKRYAELGSFEEGNEISEILQSVYLKSDKESGKSFRVVLKDPTKNTDKDEDKPFEVSLKYFRNCILKPFSQSNQLLPKFFNSFTDLSSFIPRKRYYMLNEDTKLTEIFQKLDSKGIDFINYWMKKLKIGDAFVVDEITFKSSDTVIGHSLFIRKGKILTNLVNCGSGVHKLLSLLVSMVSLSSSNNCVIIEEPEVNLHPAFQSYLADILVDAYAKFKYRFIIETHSEYIIRRLRLLIATNELPHTSCVINYFENRKEGLIVRPIEFTSTGQLSDNFGPGFFDEASNLSIELLKSVRGQVN